MQETIYAYGPEIISDYYSGYLKPLGGVTPYYGPALANDTTATFCKPHNRDYDWEKIFKLNPNFFK